MSPIMITLGRNGKILGTLVNPILFGKKGNSLCPLCLHEFRFYQCAILSTKNLTRASELFGTDDQSMIQSETEDAEVTTESKSVQTSSASSRVFSRIMHFLLSKPSEAEEAEYVVRHSNENSKRNYAVVSLPPSGLRRLLRSFIVPPLAGDEALVRGLRWQCPHCSRALPDSIEMFKCKIIAIVGTQNSGKTSYITSLIDALKSMQFTTAVGAMVDFEPIDGQIEALYNERFYNPLYKNRDAFSSNQLRAIKGAGSELEPLVYRISIGDHDHHRKHAYITFYDGAGTDMEDDDGIVRACDYILKASGVIYLIDPQKTHLADSFPEDLRKINTREETTMRKIAGKMKIFEWRPRVGRVTKPTVVTITKADLLKYIPSSEDGKAIPAVTEYSSEPWYCNTELVHDLINKQSRITKKPKANRTITKTGGDVSGQTFSIDDVRSYSNKLEQMIGQHASELWQATRSSFSNVMFAAVSSTGCNPTPDASKPNRMIYPYIKPHRCLDPVLIILYQLGMLHKDDTYIVLKIKAWLNSFTLRTTKKTRR